MLPLAFPSYPPSHFISQYPACLNSNGAWEAWAGKSAQLIVYSREYMCAWVVWRTYSNTQKVLVRYKGKCSILFSPEMFSKWPSFHLMALIGPNTQWRIPLPLGAMITAATRVHTSGSQQAPVSCRKKVKAWTPVPFQCIPSNKEQVQLTRQGKQHWKFLCPVF